MFNIKTVEQLQLRLMEARKETEIERDKTSKVNVQLGDAIYVARALAEELGLYENYKGKYVSWGFSYDELNLDLLAKDLRANTDDTERAKRLAPLKKKR